MPPRERNADQHPGYLARHVLCLALLAAAAGPAPAYTIAIAPSAPRAVYLQVGVGTFTGGDYDSGGTPGNNPTINKESVTVAANAVGNGAAQAMTTDSTQTTSFLDSFIFCSVPTQLYIGGFYRDPAGVGPVSVTATVPAALVDGAGDTISFSKISWTSSGNGDSGAEVFRTGAFTAGAVKAVGSIAPNQWAESCLTFSYLNNTFPAAGTYTGRVLYTLTAP